MLQVTDPADDFLATPPGADMQLTQAAMPAETGGGIPTPLLVVGGLALVGGLAFLVLGGGEE